MDPIKRQLTDIKESLEVFVVHELEAMPKQNIHHYLALQAASQLMTQMEKISSFKKQATNVTN